MSRCSDRKQRCHQQQRKCLLLWILLLQVVWFLPTVECKKHHVNPKDDGVSDTDDNGNDTTNTTASEAGVETTTAAENNQTDTAAAEEEDDEETDSTTAAEEEAETTTTTLPVHELKPFNATAFSLGACEKVDYAMDYITSLDFDKSFLSSRFPTTVSASKEAAAAAAAEEADEFRDVYVLQAVVFPLSLGMTFFGSALLLPTCVLASVGLGVFVVFHLVDNYVRGGLDCQMKLAGSVVCASLAAMTATSFVRFGLFSLGAAVSGGGVYMLFDAFPFLDRGGAAYFSGGAAATAIDVTETSDLTAFAWVAVIVAGIVGGLLIRWYEQPSLEIVTAIFGGIGCAYSVHTFCIMKGGKLNRSVVFLLACFIAYLGWRFQRRRRLARESHYNHPKRNEDIVFSSSPGAAGVLPQHHPQQQLSSPQQQWQPMPILGAGPGGAPAPLLPPSWQQLHSMLQQQQQQQAAASYAPLPPPPTMTTTAASSSHPSPPNSSNGPTSEQIIELNKSINSFLENMAQHTTNIIHARDNNNNKVCKDPDEDKEA